MPPFEGGIFIIRRGFSVVNRPFDVTRISPFYLFFYDYVSMQ
jgi:hypothetical protein